MCNFYSSQCCFGFSDIFSLIYLYFTSSKMPTVFPPETPHTRSPPGRLPHHSCSLPLPCCGKSLLILQICQESFSYFSYMRHILHNTLMVLFISLHCTSCGYTYIIICLMSTYTQRLQKPQKNGTLSFCLLLYPSSQHNVQHPVYTQILMREGAGNKGKEPRDAPCSKDFIQIGDSIPEFFLLLFTQ